MFTFREATGAVAVVVGAAVLAAVNHHPSHGRRTARERAAVEAAGAQFSYEQIAAAWTETKLGGHGPLQAIERAFPLPTRTVHEDGSGIVFTFQGHNGMCIDLVSGPQARTVQSRRC